MRHVTVMHNAYALCPALPSLRLPPSLPSKPHAALSAPANRLCCPLCPCQSLALPSLCRQLPAPECVTVTCDTCPLPRAALSSPPTLFALQAPCCPLSTPANRLCCPLCPCQSLALPSLCHQLPAPKCVTVTCDTCPLPRAALSSPCAALSLSPKPSKPCATLSLPLTVACAALFLPLPVASYIDNYICNNR